MHEVMIYFFFNNNNEYWTFAKVEKFPTNWPEVSADVIFFKVKQLKEQNQKKKLPIHLPALNARIQSIRSFSFATVKYRVYCGIDRPGNWSSTSQ